LALLACVLRTLGEVAPDRSGLANLLEVVAQKGARDGIDSTSCGRIQTWAEKQKPEARGFGFLFNCKYVDGVAMASQIIENIDKNFGYYGLLRDHFMSFRRVD
jgi:hypothetical protein